MTGPDDPNWGWEFRCEDFVNARLAEDQTAAEALPEGPARTGALNRVDCLRLLAYEHWIWVDRDGQSAGRCTSCPASYGVPCTTMRLISRLWRTHADYVPGWNDDLDNPRQNVGERRYAQARAGLTHWHERAQELDAFDARFDLVDLPDGVAWRCKTCGATGDAWPPPPPYIAHLGSAAATARETAPHRHPECTPAPERTDAP